MDLLREDIWDPSILGVAPVEAGPGVGPGCSAWIAKPLTGPARVATWKRSGVEPCPSTTRLLGVTHVFEESVTREPYWVMVRPPIEPS